MNVHGSIHVCGDHRITNVARVVEKPLFTTFLTEPLAPFYFRTAPVAEARNTTPQRNAHRVPVRMVRTDLATLSFASCVANPQEIFSSFAISAMMARTCPWPVFPNPPGPPCLAAARLHSCGDRSSVEAPPIFFPPAAQYLDAFLADSMSE